MVLLLSIDIGKVNTIFVVMDVDFNDYCLIKYVQTASIATVSHPSFNHMTNVLVQIPNTYSLEKVIIETQVQAVNNVSNRNMFLNNCIVSFLYGYFNSQGVTSIDVTPQSRCKFLRKKLHLPQKKYAHTLAKEASLMYLNTSDLIWGKVGRFS
eukprot:NODE_220_length_12432_cov_0.484878.p6 type:complete len:153 gc:universal NODE_220_length_12432_cov_0.484878:5911-6369(+)